MDGVKPTDLPLWAWILLGALLLTQAVWIYLDAARRGERKILWGLLGLTNVPSALIVYLLVTRTLQRTKSCPGCGMRISKRARFCPECGKEQSAGATAS